MPDAPTPPPAASACPRSGSRTRRPGSPGRTSATTGPASSPPSRGSMPRSSATCTRASASASSSTTAPPRRRARALLRRARRRSRTGSTSSRPHRPRLDARLRADLRRRDAAGRWRVTDWHFNAWAKYDNWQRDDAVPAAGRRPSSDCRRWQPERGGRRVVLEGGSIDVNGAGLLLTTEECLLSPMQAAQPGPDAEETASRSSPTISACARCCGSSRGIAGDDTHGHVDDLARFVGPRTVVTAVEEDDPPTPTTSRCRRTWSGCAA